MLLLKNRVEQLHPVLTGIYDLLPILSSFSWNIEIITAEQLGSNGVVGEPEFLAKIVYALICDQEKKDILLHHLGLLRSL